MKETVIAAQKLYKLLFSHYGPRGWWPLISRGGREGVTEGGYHPGIDYLPSTPEERFEVAVGAVLTQNTAWKNVRTCMENLLHWGPLSADAILALEQEQLEELIRPSGYFRQKSVYLKHLAAFFSKSFSLSSSSRTDATDPFIPGREELLSLKGIGEESADSILLYAFGVETAVIDAYTRRILTRISGTGWRDDRDIRDYMNSCRESQGEFHALFVEHGKEFCRSRKPRCGECFLSSSGACEAASITLCSSG